MPLLRLLSAFLLVAAPVALVACPSSTPSAVAPAHSSDANATTTATATEAPPPATTASSGPPASSTSSSGSGSPFGNNTAVKASVFSTDPCTADADCAPVATCHSDKCVAKKNAGAMTPGTLCTMDCRGGTIDCGFNHCGCAMAPAGAKRCALLAGPK